MAHEEFSQCQPVAIAKVEERAREVEECALMCAEDSFARGMQHAACVNELQELENTVEVYQEAADLILRLGPCVEPTTPTKPEGKKILVEVQQDAAAAAATAQEEGTEAAPPREPVYKVIPPSVEELQEYEQAAERFLIVIAAWKELDKIERRVRDIEERKKMINVEENASELQQAEIEIATIRAEQEQGRAAQVARRDELHKREYLLASNKQVLEVAGEHMVKVREIVEKELVFNVAEIRSEQARWPKIGECNAVVDGIQIKMAHEEGKQLESIREIQRQKQEHVFRLREANAR